MKIRGKTIGQILRLVEMGLVRINDTRDSGYIAIYDNAGDGRTAAVCSVNHCLPAKALRYFDLAQEKPRRLSSHPTHVSSYQSRCVTKDQLGGAIRVGNILLSFAGLSSEQANEALMIYLAYKAGWINRQEAGAIAGISDNHLVTDEFLGYKRKPLKSGK